MKTRSFSFIVLTTTIVTIICTFLITTAIYFYFTKSSILKMEQTTIKEIFHSLEGDIKYQLALHRIKGIESALKKYIDVANIEDIILVGPDQKTIISAKNKKLYFNLSKIEEGKLTKVSKKFLVYKKHLDIEIPNNSFSLEESILKNKLSYSTKKIRYELIFLISRERFEKDLYNTAFLALIVSIFATSIAALICLVILRSTIMPLKHISKQIQKVSFGELQEIHPSLIRKNITEIKELAESFDHMVLALKNKEKEVRKEIQGYIDALEKKNAELEKTIRQLKESQDQLIQAEKLAGLGIIAAGIAHEINNPLQVISGFCEILLNKSEDPKVKEKLLKIKKHTEDIKQIVKSLSEYSRKEKKQEHINLQEVIDAAIETSRLSKKMLGIQFIKDFKKEKLVILGKKSEIQQIFVNLFINAAQAMQGQGKIIISGKRQNGTIKILVKDTGPGIPPEIRKNIFDPFFTTKEPGEGTGLGLNIVYRIVTKYRGQIRVLENDPGAVFEIVFPSA